MVILGFVACKETTSKEQKPKEIKPEIKKPEMTIKISHKRPKAIDEKIPFDSKEWEKYRELKNFMKLLETCSPNEALSNSNELKKLVRNVKNNIFIEELNNASFRARVEVLENQALRLYDMSLIPAITAKEVNQQVEKINKSFSSVNVKINTVFKRKKFEEEISLEPFLELDSIKQ